MLSQVIKKKKIQDLPSAFAIFYMRKLIMQGKKIKAFLNILFLKKVIYI